MPRSVKKGPYIDNHLQKKVDQALETNEKKIIKTWSRRSVIFPECVGLNIAVHNGKSFIPLYVTEEMVGYKFGEFAPTRTYRGHSSKTDKRTKK